MEIKKTNNNLWKFSARDQLAWQHCLLRFLGSLKREKLFLLIQLENLYYMFYIFAAKKRLKGNADFFCAILS